MRATIHCWSESHDMIVMCDIEHKSELDRTMVYDALYKVVDENDEFSDEEYKAIKSYSIVACGYYPDAYQIMDDMYLNAVTSLSSILELFNLETSIDSVLYKPDVEIDINSIILSIVSNRLEGRSGREQGEIDVGEKIIDSLTSFIEQGEWQAGFMNHAGETIACAHPLYRYNLGSKRVAWTLDGCDVEPVIWFGLKDEKPIECWTISRDERNFIKTGYADPYDVEKWKSFWFNTFWGFDWNILTDNNTSLISWMFAERGMVGPEIDTIRRSCPISLCDKDSSESLIMKINQFFLANPYTGEDA